jgi:ferredoxin--NADP+ reductase
MTEPTPLKILDHLPLGRDARLLRLERPEWTWKAGQLISLIGKQEHDQRDYTIASGENDETLDVIYRLIPHGILTPYLITKQPGDSLKALGPYGRFTLRDPGRNLLFCATGTGIAPCRAFLRSVPGLSLTLLHGVRYPEDLYFRDEFGSVNYQPFCSREPLDGVTGRLTDTLRICDLPEDPHVYLCGANEMIYEAEEILAGRGIPAKQIFKEPYYYRAWD